MSTDPREFEHPIDGTGGNVTPLVDVIAEVLAYEHCKRVNPIMGYRTFHPDQREHLRGVQMDAARAVLAAISEAGAVEWGVFRITDAPVMRPFDEAKFTTKTAAEVFIKLGFLERVAKTLEPRSRITGPWERAE